MELQDLVSVVPSLSALTHVQKIKIFAWFLQKHKKFEHFAAANILECYEACHFEPPSNIYQLLTGLLAKRPKEILKSKRGYCLESKVYNQLDTQYGQRTATVQVHGLLLQLPGKISNAAEKSFLAEALICVRNGAPRAAIVMTWNLTYDHLLNYIMANRLADFNTVWVKRFVGHHKNGVKTITKKEDFMDELLESQVIEICKSAGIVNGNQFKILDEKLTRRNIAAHPNAVVFETLQAEDYISDLVTNVLLTI